jgi:hypothetical protein
VRAPRDRDLGNPTLLLGRQNDFAFEIFSQKLGQLREACFNLFPNGGGDFELTTGNLNVH